MEISRNVLRLLEITTKKVYPSFRYSANQFRIVARSRVALWVDMCDIASEMMYHACIVHRYMQPRINTSTACSK